MTGAECAIAQSVTGIVVTSIALLGSVFFFGASAGFMASYILAKREIRRLKARRFR
jgi:hypothetical protein